MGAFSFWHWLVVLVLALLLFGRGKIPDLMGDVAKGLKAFKRGMKDAATDDDAEDAPPPPPEPRRLAADKTAEPTRRNTALDRDHQPGE